MAKRGIPLFNIQQHCNSYGINNFKVSSLNEGTCTDVEFEEKHRHEYFEIIWFKHGSGNHQIDLQDHFFSGSVMFMLAPGQVHKIINERGYSKQNVQRTTVKRNI